MSTLNENLWQMSNKELNGLAQNRWTDNEIQIKLAGHHYLLCRQHLSQNPGICVEAIDILLKGKARSCKWNLIAGGHLDDRPNLIEEVYFNSPRSMMESWRFQYTFLRAGYWSSRHRSTPPNTPVSVLKHAFKGVFAAPAHYGYGERYWSESMSQHPNCDVELAIMMSVDPRDAVKKAGFDALVRLKRES